MFFHVRFSISLRLIPLPYAIAINVRNQEFFALSIKAQYSLISICLFRFSVFLRSLIFANGFRTSNKYLLGSTALLKMLPNVRISVFTVKILATVNKRWAIKAYASKGLILESKTEPPINFSKNLSARFCSYNVAYATWPFMTCSCSSLNSFNVIFWGLSALANLTWFCKSIEYLSASFLVSKSLPYF